jgi:SPX domain protein involved in polyphosphate accumulation
VQELLTLSQTQTILFHYGITVITMKFAEYLWKHLTPEWYSQYIEYDEMKVLLAESVAEAEQLFDITDASGREQFFIQADERFFQVSFHRASVLIRLKNRHPSSAKNKHRKSIRSLQRKSLSKTISMNHQISKHVSF